MAIWFLPDRQAMSTSFSKSVCKVEKQNKTQTHLINSNRRITIGNRQTVFAKNLERLSDLSLIVSPRFTSLTNIQHLGHAFVCFRFCAACLPACQQFSLASHEALVFVIVCVYLRSFLIVFPWRCYKTASAYQHSLSPSLSLLSSLCFF